MALFQSFKVEVFSHWDDEYMALFQSFKVEVLITGMMKLQSGGL